jgi:hypothetical protein
MHIHPSAIGPYGNNPYAAESDRAAAAQRAADVRKKLLKSASNVEAGASSPEETLLIGQWLDSRHSQVLPGDVYRSASQGKDSDFD